MKRLTVAIVAAIVSSAAFADPESGWKQTGAGPYVYDDPANWVGGVVNGVFGSDLTLTAAQTITFTNDLSLADGLSIAYAGNYALTFQSNGPGAKTLTLGGDITANVSKNGASAHVTFGSETAADNLVFNLGGANRTFTQTATQNDPSKTGWMKIYATIQNGSVTYSGLGPIKVYGSNAYSGGTTLSNTGYIYMNNADCFGSGAVTIADCGGSVWPRLHADSAVTITNDFSILGDFGFHSGHSTTLTGTLTIPSAVRFWCEVDNKFVINGPAILDGTGNCGVANLHKWGSRIFDVYTPIVVDGTAITVANGVWNQRGKISGGPLNLVGGEGGNGFFHCFAENDFTGKSTVDGTPNFLALSFQTAGALPDGVTILLKGRGMVQGALTAGYACGTMLANGRIDTSSTGCVAVASNENVDIDLSNYPGISVASAGNATYNGRITPCNGVYRFCSPSHIYLGAENALTGKADVLVEMPNAGTSLYLDKSNDVEGNVIVHNCGLILRNDTGMLPNAEVHVHGGNFYINSNKNTGARRAEYVHLHGGTLTYAGNSSYATTDSIGKLILDIHDPSYGIVGGLCQLNLNAGGKTATLNVQEFERRNNMMFRMQGTVVNDEILIGGEDGANTARLIIEEDEQILSELVGGGGDPGTPTVSVYPYGLAFKGQTYNVNDSLVTYGANGFRPLDLATEFVRTLTPGANTAQNFMLPNGTTLNITADTTVNCIFMQGSPTDTADTRIEGVGTLKTSSGVLFMGYCRFKQASVNCPVDFADKQGVVWFPSGKNTYVRNALSGSKGVILSHYAGTSSSAGGGSFAFEGKAGDSTLTGDMIMHANVYVNSDGALPTGCDIYNHAYSNLRDGIGLRGLFGTGVEMRGSNDSFNIGVGNANGDYAGELRENKSIVKVGDGRQRFSGKNVHLGSTTVNAGILQNDGAFTVSVFTVKTDATLAGSGSFGALVTLENGAKLEVGSAQLGADDAVMNFDGGLALAGDAAATFKVIGSDAVASFEASSVAGTGTLTVSLDSGALKSGDYLLAKSDAGIPFAYARGVNCGPLSLRSNGTELWMTKSAGLSIIVR